MKFFRTWQVLFFVLNILTIFLHADVSSLPDEAHLQWLRVNRSSFRQVWAYSRLYTSNQDAERAARSLDEIVPADEKSPFAHICLAEVLQDENLRHALWPKSQMRTYQRNLDEIEEETWESFSHWVQSRQNHLVQIPKAVQEALEFSSKPSLNQGVDRFKVLLDFLALSALALTKDRDNPLDLIDALNTVLFYEQNYRFPLLQTYERNIGEHSEIWSLLDRSEGVCLGVSILYYAIAQRLGLKLELLTPPGHIYLRLDRSAFAHLSRNIETTAYGAHLPDELYWSKPQEAQVRSPEEIPSLVFMNEGSACAYRKEYLAAYDYYKKAQERSTEEIDRIFLYQLCACMKVLAGLAYEPELQEYIQARNAFLQRGNTQSLLKTLHPFLIEDIITQNIDPQELHIVLEDLFSSSKAETLAEQYTRYQKALSSSPKSSYLKWCALLAASRQHEEVACNLLYELCEDAQWSHDENLLLFALDLALKFKDYPLAKRFILKLPEENRCASQEFYRRCLFMQRQVYDFELF